jgi:hypothetical protein
MFVVPLHGRADVPQTTRWNHEVKLMRWHLDASPCGQLDWPPVRSVAGHQEDVRSPRVGIKKT